MNLRLRASAGVVALASPLAIGCTQQVVEPSPTPTDARPAATPVRGQRDVTTFATNPGPVVFNESDPLHVAPEADTGAIDGFAEAVAAWLDGHLNELQNGGSGTLASVAAPGLLDGAGPELERLTTGMTNPDNHVTSARYDLRVAHDGAPIWLLAIVEVEREQGDPVTVQLMFASEGGTPVLVAIEPPAEALPEPGPTRTPRRQRATASPTGSG